VATEQRDVASPSDATRGTRQRLDHVDAMRPIKQSAVISTHALIYFAPLSTSLWASGMLTLTHFSRDAFLFVSACMLAYSYRDSDHVALGRYCQRRFMAVGLVYIIWSIIYVPVATAAPSSTFPYYRIPGSALFSLSGLHRLGVALGTGYYHLYFLLVLLEFYALFPALLWLIRRYRHSHVAFVVVAALWQIGLPYMVRHGYLGFTISPWLETRLVTSYPLYLIGGVVCAFHLEAFHDWVVRHWRGVLVTTVLAGALPLVMDALHRHYHVLPRLIVPGGDPFAAVCVPYDAGAIIAIYLLGVYLVDPRRSARTRAITKSGSEAAYGIYVSQLIWIFLLHRWLQVSGELNHVPWVVNVVGVIVAAYFAGWLFSAVFARTVVARGLVGRSRVAWSTFWPRPTSRPSASSVGEAGEGPLNLTDA
jgi:peptidoglycan/LPS O-acetylase OafA/YrhL